MILYQAETKTGETMTGEDYEHYNISMPRIVALQLKEVYRCLLNSIFGKM
jgi:hypothetical protein